MIPSSRLIDLGFPIPDDDALHWTRFFDTSDRTDLRVDVFYKDFDKNPYDSNLIEIDGRSSTLKNLIDAIAYF